MFYLPTTDQILVGYSGGKDSLVVADLAVANIATTKLFFMYFIPGLDYTEHWCQFAEKRWGVEVLRVQHWGTAYFLRRGIFCKPQPKTPRLSLGDIEAYVRSRVGWDPSSWIAYGYKAIDSLHRRGMLKSWGPEQISAEYRRCAPIGTWKNREVYAYLQRRRIPIPESGRTGSSGLDLSPQTLHWLRASWPNDYARVMKVFPQAIAQADRYEQLKDEWQRQRRERLQEQVSEV